MNEERIRQIAREEALRIYQEQSDPKKVLDYLDKELRRRGVGKSIEEKGQPEGRPIFTSERLPNGMQRVSYRKQAV